MGLTKLASITKNRITNDTIEDDALFFFAGLPGTGKSMLALHFMTLLKPDFSVDGICLRPNEFASTIKLVKDSKEKVKMILNDEGNLNRRAAMSKFNRDIIDLYYKIRALRIVHLWCNPSLDQIDRPFIEERVHGAFFLFDKKNSPRIYYYVQRRNLLKILSKYGDLKLESVRRIVRKYATYRGWFYDFDGEQKKAYLEKKIVRTSEVVDAFADSWAEDSLVEKSENEYIKGKDIEKMLGISHWTYVKYIDTMVKKEVLINGKNVFISGNSTTLTPEGLRDFRKYMDEVAEIQKKKSRERALVQFGKNKEMV
jgi:hypothetical protein